eukprot:13295119-Heterocapsa_arctica.AAC.1
MANMNSNVHSYGNAVQNFNVDNDDEQNKSTIHIRWCNLSKWGAQPNHYDLLHAVQDEAKKAK